MIQPGGADPLSWLPASQPSTRALPTDTTRPAAPLPLTRRAQREFERLAEQPATNRRARRADTTASVHSAGSSRFPARRSASRRVRRGRPITSLSSATTAFAVARSKRHPLSAVLTLLIVPGLFATAALPAYALNTDQDGAEVFSSAAQGASGQSLVVSSAVESTKVVREKLGATSAAEMQLRGLDGARLQRALAYNASGARELGDDYPWPYEASDTEGGGLSPLNYYYRECVDFVAWRLNRDAGSTKAPFTFDWNALTPGGGDASQWASAWAAHGWETSSEPKAGWVAWFNGNHVAYVKSVTDDGQVLIEEYNHGSTHSYGQRTIPVSSVALFLAPPPR